MNCVLSSAVFPPSKTSLTSSTPSVGRTLPELLKFPFLFISWTANGAPAPITISVSLRPLPTPQGTAIAHVVPPMAPYVRIGLSSLCYFLHGRPLSFSRSYLSTARLEERPFAPDLFYIGPTSSFAQSHYFASFINKDFAFLPPSSMFLSSVFSIFEITHGCRVSVFSCFETEQTHSCLLMSPQDAL